MKYLILGLILASVSSAWANQDEPYGTYYNEKMKLKIFYEMGGRGGDEFSSSRCPKKIFRPEYVADLFWIQKPTAKNKAYAISVHPMHMEIESEERCLPEGRYKKISDQIRR